MPRKKIPKEEFFKRCFDKHGNKYDYSNTHYDGIGKKIKIFCPQHNIYFFQLASDHSRGKTGCYECIKEARRNAFALGLNEFKKRAKIKYGDKFNYSKVKYVNKRKKVIIVCKEHGDVLVSPEDFLANKHGCPKCGKSIINNINFFSIIKAIKRQYSGTCSLYVLELTIDDFSCIKIGLSSNVTKRCKDIQKIGYSTKILYEKKYNDFNDGVITEYFYNNEFRNHKVKVPIKFAGYSECFSIIIKKSIINRLQLTEL
jgi:hypothetical protein